MVTIHVNRLKYKAVKMPLDDESGVSLAFLRGVASHGTRLESGNSQVVSQDSIPGSKEET